MTNSTTDYWSFNGYSLQTLGWGIETFGGNVEAPPPLRGETVTVPYRSGQIFRQKVPDSRTLTFNMYVLNCDADGNNPSESQLLTNWEALRSLFWGVTTHQSYIVKRWNGGYNTGSGLATFAGGLEPVNLGRQALRFTVDLFMADPAFYGTVETLGPYAVGTHDVTGDILGDFPSHLYTLTLTGPLTNPTITVKNGTTTVSTFTYTGSITSGKTLVVSMPTCTVSGDDTAASVRNVSTGQPQWLVLDPYATSLVVGGSGAGTVTVTHYPAYF